MKYLKSFHLSKIIPTSFRSLRDISITLPAPLLTLSVILTSTNFSFLFLSWDSLILSSFLIWCPGHFGVDVAILGEDHEDGGDWRYLFEHPDSRFRSCSVSIQNPKYGSSGVLHWDGDEVLFGRLVWSHCRLSGHYIWWTSIVDKSTIREALGSKGLLWFPSLC